MAYNYVTVSGTFATLTGTVTFTPPQVTDLTGTIPVQGPGPFPCTVAGGSFTSVPLLATDNLGLLPASWNYTATVALTGQNAYSYPVLIPASAGTAVTLSSLAVSAAGGGPGEITIPVPVTEGGTGAGGSVAALANLGAMPLAGGTFSGPAVLAGNPVSALQAAPKQYVDMPTVATPQFQGYAAWTYDAAGGGILTVPPTNTTFAGGKYYLTRLPISAAAMQQTLNGNLSFVWFSGGTAAANCFFGLYGVSGTTATLLGSQTADVSAASTGYQRKSIGSVTGLAAFPQYYVATLIGTQASGTGCGPFFAQNARNEVALNVGGSTSSVPSRCMVSVAGTQTSLPSSITLTSGNVTAGFLYPWVAID